MKTTIPTVNHAAAVKLALAVRSARLSVESIPRHRLSGKNCAHLRRGQFPNSAAGVNDHRQSVAGDGISNPLAFTGGAGEHRQIADPGSQCRRAGGGVADLNFNPCARVFGKVGCPQRFTEGGDRRGTAKHKAVFIVRLLAGGRDESRRHKAGCPRGFFPRLAGDKPQETGPLPD